jgi:transketolase
LKGEKGFVYGHRAIRELARSGSPDELYELFGLSCGKLVEELKSFVASNSK